MFLSSMYILLLRSTFMPAFPPASGLPVIKYNTHQGLESCFLHLFHTFFNYFSFRRRNFFSCNVSRVFPEPTGSGSAGKRPRNLLSVWQEQPAGMYVSASTKSTAALCARGPEGAVRQFRGSLFKLRLYIFGIIAVIPPGNPFLFLFLRHSQCQCLWCCTVGSLPTIF